MSQASPAAGLRPTVDGDVARARRQRALDQHGYAAGPLALMVPLLILAAVRGSDLFTSSGAANALAVAAPLILATLALTPIALAGRGGVDLAIGPLLGLVNVVLIVWLVDNGVASAPVIIACALGIAVAFEVVQGLLIGLLRLQPVIVTLSGFLVLAGLNLTILDKPGGLAPDWMAAWGAPTSILSPVFFVVVVALIAWGLIARTTFFRNIRLMGANERTAFASGVPLVSTRIGAHVIAGLYAGLAGLLYTALIASGDPTFGSQYTLTVVTALLLGGTSVAGGRGGALGSVLGAIDIYLISYVLATFDFGQSASFVVQMVYGLVLVLALGLGTAVVYVAAQRRKRQGRLEVQA
jgi:ribose transport system permease protein